MHGTYQQIIELSLLLVKRNFKIGGGAILVLPFSTDKRKGRAVAPTTEKEELLHQRKKRESCCTDKRKGSVAAPTKEKEELLL